MIDCIEGFIENEKKILGIIDKITHPNTSLESYSYNTVKTNVDIGLNYIC